MKLIKWIINFFKRKPSIKTSDHYEDWLDEGYLGTTEWIKNSKLK